MEACEGVTTHTLCDETFDCTMHRFVKIFWEESTFPSELLTEKILVKDLVFTPWELMMSSGDEKIIAGTPPPSTSSSSSSTSLYPRYTRRVTSQHPIPGFSWLPWLPLYTQTDKREVLKYNMTNNELTVVERSKVHGIPWHDIDVNLQWTVRDISKFLSRRQIHVLVQVQIVFHAGFIQTFAEAQAVHQLNIYFGIWQADAKAAIADMLPIADVVTDSTSPLALTIDQLVTAEKTMTTDFSVTNDSSGSEHDSNVTDDIDGTWRTVWGFPTDLGLMKEIHGIEETSGSLALYSESEREPSTVGGMSEIYHSHAGSATYSESEFSSAATVGTATSTLISDVHQQEVVEADQGVGPLTDMSNKILLSMENFVVSIWRMGDILKL